MYNEICFLVQTLQIYFFKEWDILCCDNKKKIKYFFWEKIIKNYVQL